MDNIVNAGIDIGGTKINIGLLDGAGGVLASRVIATNKSVSCERQIHIVCDILRDLAKTSGIDMNHINFIGAGVPGTVSLDSGLIDYCPNLGWVNEPAGEYFAKHLGRKVVVCQDSRNAALGEFLFGAGKGLSNMLCITVGTGIGGGIILNKKLYFGSFNTAGEVGHIILHRDGRKCDCGKMGCLERYASGTGILERARELIKDGGRELSNTEAVFELARQNDAVALKVIRGCVDDLAVGIANIVNILSVEAVIISGGISDNEELFIEPLRAKTLEYGYVGWAENPNFTLRRALLGKDAPMIGAAALYMGI